MGYYAVDRQMRGMINGHSAERRVALPTKKGSTDLPIDPVDYFNLCQSENRPLIDLMLVP
ncbi:MAG: hypothetical protein IJB45_01450 [Clostridia bacterium]|nr:hypothetical protein [Clostridia bacterium]